jgi:hypothetical protein
MSLDVTTPDPPDLTNRGLPAQFDPDELSGSESELSRDALEEALRDGAWSEAFQEWAAYTDLTEAEYRELDEGGLLEAVDFYWDPFEERLRFDVPPMPGWMDEEFAARARVELTDLAETVVETLEDTYEDWTEAGPSDAVWTEELYDDGAEPGE